jgi:hypothetical protein
VRIPAIQGKCFEEEIKSIGDFLMRQLGFLCDVHVLLTQTDKERKTVFLGTNLMLL